MAKYKAYPEYKDSGVEWLGGIPSHWIQSKFGYLKTILTDYTANGSFADLKSNVTYLNEPSYARLVRLTDLRHNLNNNGIWIDFKSYKFLSKSALYGGEFLLANVGANAGLFYQMPYNKGPASLAPNMFMAKFSVNKVSGEFIAYTGESDSILKQLTLKATASSAQPKLNKDDFKSIFCCYPSLTEQKIICNFLNCETVLIGKLIAKQQQLIELLKEKRQAVISHAVTKGLNPDAPMKDSGVEWLGDVPCHWNVAKLKYISTLNNQTLSDSTSKHFLIKYIDIGNISKENGISNPEEMFFSEAPSRARRIVKDGDVIISTVRTYLEAIAIILNPPHNLVVSTGFAVIHPQKLSKKFSLYSFKDRKFIQKIISMSEGISYPAINASDLMTIKIPFPEYLEQDEIGDFLHRKTAKIDTLIQKQRQQIDLLKERRTALIAAAVTGKIDLRDWTPPASSTEASLAAEETTA